MHTHIRPAVVMLALFTGLTGIVYPLLVTGIAQVAAPYQANGSLIAKDGKTIGSDLIGQPFLAERYFHPRRSATSAPDPKDDTKTIDTPYNASSSSGSNLGPTAKALVERVKLDIEALKGEAGASNLPADAVTASASGLDPEISRAAAAYQAARVARVRGLVPERVAALIEANASEQRFGFLGEPRVNVLALNLALDALAAR